MGIDLSESTVGDWTAKSIEVLNYLYPLLVRAVESAEVVQVYKKEQATWMIEKYQELYAIEALARE